MTFHLDGKKIDAGLLVKSRLHKFNQGGLSQCKMCLEFLDKSHFYKGRGFCKDCEKIKRYRKEEKIPEDNRFDSNGISRDEGDLYIVRLLSYGKLLKEIGREFGVSRRMIENRVRLLRSKSKTVTLYGLVAYYLINKAIE